MNGKNDGLKKGVAVLLVLLMVSSGFFVMISDNAAAKSGDVSDTANPADMGPVQEKKGVSNDNTATAGNDVNSNAVQKDVRTQSSRDKFTTPKDVKDHATHPEKIRKTNDRTVKEAKPRPTHEVWGEKVRPNADIGTIPIPSASSAIRDPMAPTASSWDVSIISAQSGTGDAPTDTTAVVFDVDADKTYTSLQGAIDNAASGNRLIISGTLVENISVDGKSIKIINSSFDLVGDLVVKNGGSLLIDPTWINQSGNFYVGAGSTTTLDDTILQFNNSYDGEFGIQANTTGTLIIQNNSKLQSNGTAQYWFHVLARAGLAITDSTVRDCGWNESEPGPVILANNIYVHNSTFTNDGAGMVLFGASNAIIENSTFYGNFMGGVGLIDGSNGNYIANNSFDGGEGVHIENASYNRILTNTMANCDYGIYVNESTGSTLSNNTITAYNGIYMENADKNALNNNDITFANDRYLGLVGYWKMDEQQWTGVFGEVKDSSGNNNDGTPYGDAHIDANGKYGNAGCFDGSSDYVGSIWGNSLNTGSQLTMEAWVNLTDAAVDQKIVGKSPIGSGYVMGVGLGGLYPEIWDTAGSRYYFQAGSIPSKQWVHLAVTWQTGGRMIAYVNGQQVGNISASVQPIGGTWNPLVIGAAPWNTNKFGVNGLIDEVKIFNRALSQEEINHTYNSEFAYGIYMKDSADNNISFNPAISDISGYGDAGIYLDNSSPYINYANIHNSLQGLICVNGASPLMVSSHIWNDVVDDVYVYDNSHPILLNTTFNKNQGYVMDSLSNLTVEWYLDVYVRDSGGTPISGASVNLTDRQGNYFTAGTTDASGHLGPLVLIEYVQNWTEKDYRSPYNVYADDGASYGSEPVLLDTSKAVYITLGLQYVHNVEQNTDYPGIRPAVIMANPGDHLEIYGGMHNETALVDKAVHIAGVVTPLPVVNGNGSAPTFVLAAEGVEITALNITNTGTMLADCGIYATVGGFNIHDNLLYTQAPGLYVDIYHYGEGSTSIGDMNIYSNRMEGGGIYFERMQFDRPLNDSTIMVGQIDIHDNWINSTSGSGVNGVKIEMEHTQYLYGSTSVDMAGISVTGNHINSSSESFYLSLEYIGYNMYDTSSFTFGNIDITNNELISENSVAVYVYVAYGGYYMYNYSQWSIGGVNIINNTITSGTGSYGVDAYISHCAAEMHGDSFATFATWNILWNNITGEYGIFTGPEYCGYDMYDDAEFIFHDWNIMYNNIDVAENGIDSDYYECAEEMSDNSRVSGGNNTIMYNDVNTETSEACYLYYYELGYYMYDSSYASFGWTSVMYNTFHSNQSDGAYLDIYNLGAYMEGDSQAYIGDLIFAKNDVLSNRSYGIDFDEWYENGYYNAGNSYVEIGDVLVNDNTITTNATLGDCGIYLNSWEDDGAYLMDFSTVVFGDFEFNNNTINSGDDGIYASEWDDWGYELSYDWNFGAAQAGSCRVSMGHVQFNGNIIDSNSDGIYIYDVEDIAYEMYGSSTFVMKNYEVCDNIINASDYGMDLEYFEYMGYDMYDYSKATFGDFLFNWNTVTNASGYAFYSNYIKDLAYEMYDNSIATFGDFEFNNNTMHSTNAGVYIYNKYWGYDMYGSSRAYFGHIQMNDNHVNTTGSEKHGIEMDYIDEFAYDMYDNAYFEMGNLEICRNAIKTNRSGSGNGIEIDIEYLGDDMYGSSHATFKDFLFNDNTIEAGGDGIYFENFYEAGSYMYNYSSFIMGDVDINGNNIDVSGDGVYFEPYAFGSEMYYGSIATFGTNHIMNNSITTTDGYGIYAWWWYEFGYYLYENAYVKVGDAIITGNTISVDGSSNDGIYTGPDSAGEYVYDNSAAEFGNHTVSYNTVFSNRSIGIDFYCYDVGYGLYANSYSTSAGHVSAGDMNIEHNDITAPGDTGIHVDYEYNAYGIAYDSWIRMGDMLLRNNTINAHNGIYVDMESTGHDLYINGAATLGMTEISGNTVTANNTEGYGLLLGHYQIAYDLHDSSVFNTGDVLIHDNTVQDSYDGLGIGYDQCGNTYGNSYGEIPGVYAYGNTINAVNIGIYLYSKGNPFSYSGGTQVWGPLEIYDSTVNSGNGTYLDADAASTKPDIWIHDVTFTKTGPATNTTGIYGIFGAATFERCNFLGYEQGIYASGSDFTVGSSTFTGVTGRDINMTNAAYVFMVDDTFSKTNVLFQDNASLLDIGWYITINVITQTGNGVPYANVTYTSNVSAPTVFTKSLMVNGNGQYVDMLREYRQNITGIIEQYNNYNMTGSKAGLTGWLVPDPTPIDASKNVYVVLTDTDPPILGEDTSDTAGTTGDPFTFRVNATDTVGMNNVTVYYRYGSSGAYSSAVMSSSDNITWTYTMNLSSNFIGNMGYYFVATDLAGNTDTGSNEAVPVTDNDAPYGLVDNSPAVAYGPTYEFNMSITDNINVTSVSVTYWFDSENHTTTPMNGAGPWTYTIDLNCSWNSTLHYYFAASDAAGNVFTGPITDVMVNDNEAPVITADNSDTVATTGDVFHFSLNATDNFEIGSVTAIYWFGNGTHSSTILTGSGTYSGSMVIDSGSTDTLHYYFNVTDAAGNYVVSDTIDVNVTDNDLPTITDITTGNPVMGNTFIIIGEVTDNVGISGVYLEYWFDNGTRANESMQGVGDIWIFSVSVPEDAAQLHYIFHADDETEWNSSSETILDTQEPIDNEAPLVVDSTTAIPITGRDFTFSASASDNVGVAGVYVEYWFDSGDHSNTSMVESGAHWELTMSIPTDVTELHYVFHAVDTSDNWASTAEAALAVEATSSDNEPPAITDTTTGVPLSGMAFTFSANVTDNVGVAGVYVEYWFDSGDHNNISMANTGSGWKYSITVPAGVNRLHYTLSARDTSANWNSLAETELNVQALIIDTEDPAIVSIHTSESAREGADFSFTVTATDNVGVGTVYVVYWTDENEHAMALLTGENGTYTGTIAVPLGSQLHFYPVVKDLVGNTAQGNQTDMDITPTSGGTIAPSILGGTNLLLIVIIVILLLMVIYLAATRNKGGKGGAPEAAVEEAPEVGGPEEGVDEAEEPAPENTEAPEENSEPEQAEAQEEAGDAAGESPETEGAPEEEKGEVLDLADF